MGDERKRRRMESNRESARRSRLRKQQQVVDLTAQLAHLRKTGDEILMRVRTAKRHAAAVEADNSALKGEAVQLLHRLHSLREILNCINSGVAFMGNNISSSAHELFNQDLIGG